MKSRRWIGNERKFHLTFRSQGKDNQNIFFFILNVESFEYIEAVPACFLLTKKLFSRMLHLSVSRRHGVCCFQNPQAVMLFNLNHLCLPCLVILGYFPICASRSVIKNITAAHTQKVKKSWTPHILFHSVLIFRPKFSCSACYYILNLHLPVTLLEGNTGNKCC